MEDKLKDLWYLKLPSRHMAELIFIVEAYEGMAVCRVLDKEQGVIELLVAPDRESELETVLGGLRGRFEWERVERPPGVKSIADDIESD